MTKSAALLACLAACGGNSGTPADAPIIPDASCIPVSTGDGGQVTFEYLTYDSELQVSLGLPSGVATQSRLSAFFVSHQTPETTTRPGVDACIDLTTTMVWPMYVGTPRTELDVGAVDLRGMTEAGPARTITPPKLTAGTDDWGRARDIYYELVQPDASQFMKPGSSYELALGGAGSIASRTFANALAIPNTFSVTTPALEDNGPLVAGTDYTVSWTPSTANGMGTGALIWLADANGLPTHLCISAHSAGTFTIPGVSIAEFKQIAQARGVATNKLILRRDAISAQVAIFALDNCTDRNTDVFGIFGYAQLMDVQ